MPLRITFLGTGSAFTDYRVNYHNNALVHTSEGPVLIDCGGTAPQALRELGLPASAIRLVCITHLHGDHVGGLEQLVWERLYTGPDGPRFLPTPVVAEPRVLAQVRASVEPLIGWHTRRDRVVADDGWEHIMRPEHRRAGWGHAGDEAETWTVGGCTFSLHRTPHVSIGGEGGKVCTGVRVRAIDGSELYFTSDTEFRPDIGERFPDAVLFHDTTFMGRFEGTVHTHYSELVELPDAVRARIVLMHHDRVPDGIDPVADGFAAAAHRFHTFEVGAGHHVERISATPATFPGV